MIQGVWLFGGVREDVSIAVLRFPQTAGPVVPDRLLEGGFQILHCFGSSEVSPCGRASWSSLEDRVKRARPSHGPSENTQQKTQCGKRDSRAQRAVKRHADPNC